MGFLALPHGGNHQTGRYMWNMAREYSSDLGSLLALPFARFWALVRDIPYIQDSDLLGDPFHEILSRPKNLLNPEIFPALDCKKKSILVMAYCLGRGIPCKIFAAWEDPNEEGIHHVFPVVKFGDWWYNADPTFPMFSFGMPKPTLIHAEELFP